MHIRTTPSITINNHSKGEQLTYENPVPTLVDLLIDKGKYYAFNAEDVDKKQSDYNFMEDWTRDAAEQLKISIDTDILANTFADAHADNQGATAGVISNSFDLGVTGSPVVLTKANILDVIVNMGTVLDEQNVPETGRFVVLPPWACGMIKKSDQLH